ncbi:transposase [Bremerella cremea]|uniref:transposase n=1 Tax=Bremerella cremea TaxID=1031537 RepID=UPI0031E73A3D
MKKSKLPDQQLAFPLKQTEAGTPMEKVCRKLGVRQQAFYRWKKKFGGVALLKLDKRLD